MGWYCRAIIGTIGETFVKKARTANSHLKWTPSLPT